MHIIICGAGQVGFNLAKYLSENEKHVTVIDINTDLINYINERLDVRAVCGHASYPEVLIKAGIEEADMLIAVTQHDEVNMIACEVTNALFKVPLKIARIRNQSYLQPKWQNLFSHTHLSIDYIISPEVELAQSISRSLTVPGAFHVAPLANGLVKMIGVRCTGDTPIINTPVSHVNALFTDLDITIIALIRDTVRFIPSAKDVILPGDELYFVVDATQVEAAMLAFGHKTTESRRLVILGGGNVGLRLAEEVSEKNRDFKTHIIEKRPERAQEIAEKLHNTIVLCGDSLESEILEEAGVASAETVVAVTQDDRVNVLSALLAKKMGAARSLILLNNPSYGPLLNSLGVDGVIDPRSLTVSRILQHIRQGKVKSVLSVAEGLGELIEGEVSPVSDLVGTPPWSYTIKGEILIVAIVRRGEVLIPHEGTLIAEHDHIIIMAAKEAIGKVEKLFSSSLDYF